MILFLAILAAFFLGARLGVWLAERPPSLPGSHENCDQRFDLMERRLNFELRRKEEEIQRLLAGHS
jgi:hypothetical protein